MVTLGIQQQYPIYIGTTIKEMLSHKFPVQASTFKDFVLFLESCKGYEEDAKRFVSLAHDTEHIQVDYEMLQPLFLRTMKHKKGTDVLKLFEQLRKVIKVNKSGQKIIASERSTLLKQLKIDFYDGLVTDLMKTKAYSLSQVIQSEKAREKFEPTIRDDLITMEIYANQHKLEEFQILYRAILGEKSTYVLDQQICEDLSSFLMNFTSEEDKNARLEMTEQLQDIIIKQEIMLSSKMFHSLIYLYTESQ
jgi:hypothetical protein